MTAARNFLGAALAVALALRLIAWLIEPVIWLVAVLFALAAIFVYILRQY